MPHIALLGDSIFDNARYTNEGPDVAAQVHSLLPPGGKVSLLAVDGSTTEDIVDQMRRLPREATHLILSVGGNNALMHASKLGIPLFGIAETSTTSALQLMADIAKEFETAYRAGVETCLQPGLPLAVCTIYNGCFPDAAYQRIISVALAIFNDVILRVAIEYGLSVIDLRSVCTDPEDYANPIEPSSVGGEKIAQVIVGLVTAPESFVHTTRIFCAHTESRDAD